LLDRKPVAKLPILEAGQEVKPEAVLSKRLVATICEQTNATMDDFQKNSAPFTRATDLELVEYYIRSQEKGDVRSELLDPELKRFKLLSAISPQLVLLI